MRGVDGLVKTRYRVPVILESWADHQVPVRDGVSRLEVHGIGIGIDPASSLTDPLDPARRHRLLRPDGPVTRRLWFRRHRRFWWWVHPRARYMRTGSLEADRIHRDAGRAHCSAVLCETRFLPSDFAVYMAWSAAAMTSATCEAPTR